MTFLYDKLTTIAKTVCSFIYVFMIKLALYQPDIPQNTGSMLRLAACLGISVDIIEPCGFIWNEKKMRRAGMDYLDNVAISRHSSWDAYQKAPRKRLILMSTKAAIPYMDFKFEIGDTLLMGRESAGVPEDIHNAADARIIIPMLPEMRSINVAMSAAMVIGEGLRQLNAFPNANNGTEK